MTCRSRSMISAKQRLLPMATASCCRRAITVSPRHGYLAGHGDFSAIFTFHFPASFKMLPASMASMIHFATHGLSSLILLLLLISRAFRWFRWFRFEGDAMAAISGVVDDDLMRARFPRSTRRACQRAIDFSYFRFNSHMISQFHYIRRRFDASSLSIIDITVIRR